MSRTYSKNRYRQSIREGWYDEEYVGRGRNARWVKVPEERRKALCKRNAAKSKVGTASAPSRWVRDVFTAPERRKAKETIRKVIRQDVDAEAAIFPAYRRQAWYLWY